MFYKREDYLKESLPSKQNDTDIKCNSAILSTHLFIQSVCLSFLIFNQKTLESPRACKSVHMTPIQWTAAYTV